ncbi:hypothetical protein ES708_28615 [subsurface metagenome]
MDGAGRGRLVGGAAAVAGPAVGLRGQVVLEVAQVVAGERRRRRPVFLVGEVAQAVEAHLVVVQRVRGEASARPGGDLAARLHETGDEFVEGEVIGTFRYTSVRFRTLPVGLPGCCYHFSSCRSDDKQRLCLSRLLHFEAEVQPFNASWLEGRNSTS